jgi:hypothetical protein
MATIDAKNGKNFITVTAALLGGLGAAIGLQMNMLIGNRRDPLRSLTTFWGTFEWVCFEHLTASANQRLPDRG